MDKLYHQVSFRTSELVTSTYSTSFTIGVRCLHPEIRDAIYSIYGFVRLADEIVDTFHDYNREELLQELERDYYEALQRGISLNPVLNSFQYTVREYGIPDDLVQAFLKSMQSDLYMSRFDEKQIGEYIYGSAESVGLMCLKVFVKGDQAAYDRLKPYAQRLGAAFQKINFLRDLRHDTQSLHRVYFPVLKNRSLDEDVKEQILDDIMEDYSYALTGIRQLPECARLGVYTAYLYYYALTEQLYRTRAKELMKKRVRISDMEKMLLFGKAWLHTKMDAGW